MLQLPGTVASTAIEVNCESLSRIGGLLCAANSIQVAESVVLVSDRAVAPLHATAALLSLQKAGIEAVMYIIEPGETSKSLASAEGMYRFLSERRFPRDGMIVALGGGVVSDLAGFVAATWMRGVRWAICPTTLEAMIDASIGGKTAINIPGGKNLVGAFHPPELVLIDPTCLRTLPEREFRAGLAESVKHALLGGEEFFAWHEKNADAIVTRDPDTLSELIERNVRFKVSVVASDPRERTGARMILNLGHTTGHAIEEACGYSLRHGECVALGLIAACELSTQICGLDRSQADRVSALLARFGLPTRMGVELTLSSLTEAVGRDKKVRSGEVQWVLLRSIGTPAIQSGVEDRFFQLAVSRLLP